MLHLLHGPLALAPGLGDQAGKPAGGKGELEDVIGFRQRFEDLLHLVGEDAGLVDSGIGRGLDNTENDPLVFFRREFLGRRVEEPRDG